MAVSCYKGRNRHRGVKQLSEGDKVQHLQEYAAVLGILIYSLKAIILLGNRILSLLCCILGCMHSRVSP